MYINHIHINQIYMVMGHFTLRPKRMVVAGFDASPYGIWMWQFTMKRLETIYDLPWWWFMSFIFSSIISYPIRGEFGYINLLGTGIEDHIPMWNYGTYEV